LGRWADCSPERLAGFWPGYASARWKLEGDFELKYTWDEPAGRQHRAALS
jgi:hypothetical protein